MADKNQLLKEINDNSFAVNDTVLYLDNHPEDAQALKYFQECREKRKQAMQQFEAEYYPLTVDCVNADNAAHWSWGDAPAPWEGGCC